MHHINAGTRSITPADKKNPEVMTILNSALFHNNVLELKDFGRHNTEKLTAKLLSNAEVQAYPRVGAFATGKGKGNFKVCIADIPFELKKMIYNVTRGNPKNILEMLDPLLSGYNKVPEYKHNNSSSGSWSVPVIAITGHHQIQILDNPVTEQLHDLNHFPWPSKIVQYAESRFQEMDDSKQYILRCASIFKDGFTSSLMKPFSVDECFDEEMLDQLVDEGFLYGCSFCSLSYRMLESRGILFDRTPENLKPAHVQFNHRSTGLPLSNSYIMCSPH
jgi:hypothetical protein